MEFHQEMQHLLAVEMCKQADECASDKLRGLDNDMIANERFGKLMGLVLAYHLMQGNDEYARRNLRGLANQYVEQSLARFEKVNTRCHCPRCAGSDNARMCKEEI